MTFIYYLMFHNTYIYYLKYRYRMVKYRWKQFEKYNIRLFKWIYTSYKCTRSNVKLFIIYDSNICQCTSWQHVNNFIQNKERNYWPVALFAHTLHMKWPRTAAYNIVHLINRIMMKCSFFCVSLIDSYVLLTQRAYELIYTIIYYLIYMYIHRICI